MSTYWYCDLASAMSPETSFTGPGGISSSAAISTAISNQRQPSSSVAATAHPMAAPIRVRWVPTRGMVSSAGAKVPAMLPIVDSA